MAGSALSCMSGTLAPPRLTTVVRHSHGARPMNNRKTRLLAALGIVALLGGCGQGKGSNRRLEFELGAGFEGACVFALVLALSQMKEHGLGPFGRADLHPRRNPLDRQGRFAPQPGSAPGAQSKVQSPQPKVQGPRSRVQSWGKGSSNSVIAGKKVLLICSDLQQSSEKNLCPQPTV